MTNLVLFWLLFVVPVLAFALVGTLFLALLLGAHIYHAGKMGMAPSITVPKFGVSRSRNGNHERSDSERLPAV